MLRFPRLVHLGEKIASDLSNAHIPSLLCKPVDLFDFSIDNFLNQNRSPGNDSLTSGKKVDSNQLLQN